MTARWMLRAAALALVAASALTLGGCAFGPDPDEVRAEASNVFDALVADLGTADPAVLRTVEVVETEPASCGENADTQESFVARGTLSVQAEDGAAGSILTDLSDVLDQDEWTVTPAEGDGQRAWSSSNGIVVALTDASPVLVVAVFPPCLPAS